LVTQQVIRPGHRLDIFLVDLRGYQEEIADERGLLIAVKGFLPLISSIESTLNFRDKIFLPPPAATSYHCQRILKKKS